MRHLVLALVGLTLLFGQSSGPAGLTGAAAIGSGNPETIQHERGSAVAGEINATANQVNGRAEGQGEMQSAILVGGVVANVAAASIDQSGNK